MGHGWVSIVGAGFALALAAPAVGQAGPNPAATERPRSPQQAPSRLPPPVLCRVLVPGLPPERQPPPMDCDTARRQAAIAGGEVVVGTREPGGALRISVSDERYRRDQAARDALEEARSRGDRDREWRDGTWDDRSRFDDDDLRVWPD